MGPDQATADRYDVLFIDDVCSFLTPRLVRSIRESGREIVGVYDSVDAPDAKRHLLECGITDVIEADAAPEEFLAAAAAMLIHRAEPRPMTPKTSSCFRVGVLGPVGGVGTTEIAIGLASSLARRRSTILVDLDQMTPSVAQRLDLPLHPNLLTAVDAAHYSVGGVREAILSHESVDVVGGLVKSSASALRELAPVEVEGLLDEIGSTGYQVLVADLGAPPPDDLDLLRFHALIVVGLANPVGIARLVRMTQRLVSNPDTPDTVAVLNRVGPGSGRRQEIRAEMARLLPTMPVILLPEDRRLERASWDGTNPVRGPFAKSVGSVASLLDEAVG
jgi:MinD-like ATPase involved in chromosome partitioning or flagellar assembly